MDYKQLIKTASESGNFKERTMWESIDNVADLLNAIKQDNPELYWSFMRQQHGILYNNHYTQQFAEYDVAQLQHTCGGQQHNGGHWTVEQTQAATKGMRLPDGVTKWDVYVALNAMAADACGVLDEDKIIEFAVKFHFFDEDWADAKQGESPNKIWQYMSCAKKP
jgi:hypothetical protein